MEQAKKYRLLADHFSNFSGKNGKRIQYGKRGEIVTLIREYGEVMAVEAKDGSRYPIRIEKLAEL